MSVVVSVEVEVFYPHPHSHWSLKLNGPSEAGV